MNPFPKKLFKRVGKKFSFPLDRKALSIKRKKYWLLHRYIESQDVQIYTEHRRCCNKLRSMTRKATKRLEKDIAKNSKSNPKKFWKYVNSKRIVKSQNPDLYLSDDEDRENMANQTLRKRNAWHHFSRV